jgi:hypothetical protein
MAGHCCGGHGSKEPLGWEGGLFMSSLFGLLGCKLLAEFSDFDKFAGLLAWICGGLTVVSVFICWFSPKKKTCDHHDHHDEAHK